jgi:hypothetical protein
MPGKRAWRVDRDGAGFRETAIVPREL